MVDAWKRGNTKARWGVTQMKEMSNSGSYTRVEFLRFDHSEKME